MNKTVAYKYIVAGRVQGVGFRWFVQKLAAELNIVGTVRNTLDGNVEIFAQSDINSLQKFKSQVNLGPALSRVGSIKEIEEENNNQLVGFKVIV